MGARIAEEVTATLTVPDEHAELFRLGALHELNSNAEWVQQQGEECAQSGERMDEHARYLLDSMGGPMRYLDDSGKVVRALFAGETTITAHATNLSHIAEAMGRHVVKPRIADALGCSPIETDDVDEVRSLSAALVWATETAAAMYAVFLEAASADATNGKVA